MAQFTPLYVTYTVEDSSNHYSLGNESATLCGCSKITSAFQAESPSTPDIEISSGSICEECKRKMEIAQEFVNIEPTVECDRCGYNYGVSIARSVENMDKGIVPVCRPCYDDLLNADDSGVTISYSEAEPYYDTDEDRSFQAPKELQQKWSEISE